MISNNAIESAVARLFGTLEFTREPAGLYDPLRYMIEIGGKRLRPTLCLSAYSLYQDGSDDGFEWPQNILSPAAGLEIFHSFTLIHDDIMDKSQRRRGQPTVWTEWGNGGAILSGDVMCIDSYKRVAQAPADVLGAVLELFSTTAAEVCEGQQYDMEFESRVRVGMEEYMRMIGLKTSVLIACSAKMGALIAGAPEEDCDNLYKYGYDLGLAFQIMDDYLDAYGDESVFGKPIGGDILNRKQSWLTVHFYEKAECNLVSAMDGAFEMEDKTEAQKAAKISAVKTIYESLNIEKEALAEVRRLTDSALDYASRLHVGDEGKELLREFAYKLVRREK